MFIDFYNTSLTKFKLVANYSSKKNPSETLARPSAHDRLYFADTTTSFHPATCHIFAPHIVGTSLVATLIGCFVLALSLNSARW